ncbi:MAG TPA: CBS domain-containing protein [Steroidobacteraceae bacterium]|nr:CBS domain-containing protein [Steroidobacteraceae bacterium]
MSLGAVCNREVTIARATESLHTAAELMRAGRVGSIVVCEEDGGSKRRPIGVLTDRDVVMALLQHSKGLGELLIGQAMTRNPLLLHDEDEVEEAIERLRERAVRRAPVVDAHGSLIGIVSSDDLLELIAEELDAIARLIRRQRPA